MDFVFSYYSMAGKKEAFYVGTKNKEKNTQPFTGLKKKSFFNMICLKKNYLK